MEVGTAAWSAGFSGGHGGGGNHGYSGASYSRGYSGGYGVQSEERGGTFLPGALVCGKSQSGRIRSTFPVLTESYSASHARAAASSSGGKNSTGARRIPAPAKASA